MKTVFICLVLLFYTVDQADAGANEGWVSPEWKDEIEKAKTIEPEIEANFRSDNKREQEVLKAWRMYFNEWGIEKPSEKRTKDYREYAKHIVKWVGYYEKNEGVFGGKLPAFEDNHILIAVIIQKETGIYSHRRGPRGEVGLMQVWDIAQGDYTVKQILEKPELGVMLGIQWLAYSTTRCRQPKKWKATSWLKPLTQYGAGPKATVNGKCEVFSFARRRVNKTMIYRREIDRSRIDSL